MAKAKKASRLPLFYQQVEPLNKEKHGTWFLEAQNDFFFSKDTNCVYVAGIEFPLASKEYPIVFALDADHNPFPVVLLGLRNDENLFLDEKGKWLGKYVPAYIRRYPFILARGEEQNYTVCIDESFADFNTVKEGEQLFTKDGEQTPLLDNSMNFLKEYEIHVEWTNGLCKALKDLDILESMQANITLKNGEKLSLSGLMVVNKDKLKKLDAKVLKDLVEKDYLDMIYAHVQSLANMNSLLGRIPQE